DLEELVPVVAAGSIRGRVPERLVARARALRCRARQRFDLLVGHVPRFRHTVVSAGPQRDLNYGPRGRTVLSRAADAAVTGPDGQAERGLSHPPPNRRAARGPARAPGRTGMGETRRRR